MSNSFPTDTVIDRCLSVAGRCVFHQYNAPAREFMRAQFQEIAQEIAPWRLDVEEEERLILQPTWTGLVNRYGLAWGRKLYLDFVLAFWKQSPLELVSDRQ